MIIIIIIKWSNMKKIIFAVIVFFGLIISLFIMGFLYILKIKNKDEIFIKVFLKNFSKVSLKMLNVKVNIKNKEKLKVKKTLIVSNHLSLFDILVLIQVLDENIVFISKKENESIPIVSLWMKITNTLYIDRNNPRQSIKIINQASEILEKKNKNVIIFPQGTRNENTEDFKPGALKIAQKVNAKVLTLSLSETNKILDGFFSYKKINVEVIFGTLYSSESENYQKSNIFIKQIQNEIFSNVIKKI